MFEISLIRLSYNFYDHSILRCKNEFYLRDRLSHSFVMQFDQSISRYLTIKDLLRMINVRGNE